MRTRLEAGSWATALLIAIAVAGLYGTRLSFSPVYLIHDELQFALQAQAIATTGHDLDGHLLPVYFPEQGFPAGRDPLPIYATAIGLAVWPFSEASARFPTAMVGVVDVVLMFFLSRRLFGRDWMGVLGAVVLALTPGHFMRSRLVLSPVFALPFIFAWLISLERFTRDGRPRDLLAAAAWLSLGMYSYLACMVMMPLYLVLTIWIVARRGQWPMAPVAAWGFLVPLVPMALWYATHAERYSQIVDAYRLLNAGQSSPGGVPSLGLIETVRLRLDLYWSFFSPDFLFLSGQTSLIDSTRNAGVFAIALAVFMPIGAYALARGRAGVLGRVILVGLFTAPLATVMSGHIEMNRLLFVIPFGVLTAMYGADVMLRAGASGWRWIAIALLLTIPWQFQGFYRDYMGAYRVGSSAAFGGNVRDALIDVIHGQAGERRPVYLSQRIPYVDRYWRFYTIAQGRSDLITAAVFVDVPGFDAGAAPAGTPLVCAAGDPGCEALQGPGGWSKTHTATELDGTPAFAVYEKR